MTPQWMSLSRRRLIGAMAAGALLPGAVAEAAERARENTLLRHSAPAGGRLTIDDSYRERLARGTFACLDSQLRGERLSLWGGNAWETLGMSERIDGLADLVCAAIEGRDGVRQLDPPWMMAQLWWESQYNPFALSQEHAAGIAQFIPATGKQYGLRVAWPQSELGVPQTAERSAFLEDWWRRYASAREETRALAREVDALPAFSLGNFALLANGELPQSIIDAAKMQIHKGALEERYGAAVAHRKEIWAEYGDWIRQQIAGKDAVRDREYLSALDERLVPEAAVPAAVRYMHAILQRRQGLHLTAGAEYNAGPHRVDWPEHESGLLPEILEPRVYIARILRTHAGIVEKMGEL